MSFFSFTTKKMPIADDDTFFFSIIYPFVTGISSDNLFF